MFDKPIGYLFIDGDHQYESVSKDLKDWYPKVVSNGYIALHDSAVGRGGPKTWPGPSKLAKEIILNEKKYDLEYITTIYTLTVFRKK
jgi:hypothetical protein